MHKYGMRAWSPYWTEVGDDPLHSEAVHKMIVASINWIEAHGDINDLQWQERDIQTIMQEIMFAPWTEFFRPNNETTSAWFDQIADSCVAAGEHHVPSVAMMKQAMFAGIYVGLKGWDAFNLLMYEPTTSAIN